MVVPSRPVPPRFKKYDTCSLDAQSNLEEKSQRAISLKINRSGGTGRDGTVRPFFSSLSDKMQGEA